MLAIFSRVVVFSVVLFTGGAAHAQRITVAVNGNPVRFSGTQPQEVDGRVMVPLRGVLEQIGAVVRWDPASRSVTASREGTVIRLPVNQTTAEVNGRAVTLDVPAMLMMGRTMVPLRFVAESLGAAVTWDNAARTVRIATASPDESAAPRDSRAFVRTRTVAGTRRPGRVTAEPLITSLAFIRENAVIPVTLDTAVDSQTTKPGDRVTATVEVGAYDARLPKGTQFIGTVRQAVPARDGRSGLVSLLFTELAFPDGTWRTINGIPFPIDARSVMADSAGYWVERPGAASRNVVYVGYEGAARLGRADVMPGGRVRVFMDPASLSGAPRDGPAGDVTLAAGHRFGIRIDRQLTFDPIRAVPLDDR